MPLWSEIPFDIDHVWHVICRPLLHAILHSNIKATYGIEVDAVKCQKACPFVSLSVTELASHGVSIPVSSLPKFICAPIEQVSEINNYCCNRLLTEYINICELIPTDPLIGACDSYLCCLGRVCNSSKGGRREAFFSIKDSQGEI